jgi:pectate lyase
MDTHRPDFIQAVVRSLIFVLLVSVSCSAAGSRRNQSVATPLPDAIGGFASGATGGDGGPVRSVTSLEDSGPGTLREAASTPGPALIRFKVAGTITLASPVRVRSDLTIDGRSAPITLENKGLVVRGADTSNVIISDLRFTRIRGVSSDGIQIRDGARRIWVHHCEFSDGEDGAVDVTRGATDVTISWNFFHDHDKVMLINGEESVEIPKVTVHHNLFVNTRQRNPRLVRAQAHAYNNHLKHWTGIGMQAAEDSQLLSESNVFEAALDVDGIVTRGERQGAVRSTGDLLLNGARATERDPETVFRPEEYTWRLQEADQSLVDDLNAKAGPRVQAPSPAATG